MRYRYPYHVLLGCLLSASVVQTALMQAGCSKPQAAGGFARPPMPVEVASVQSQKVTDRFEAIGTIQALDAITVVSEMDASVLSLPFAEGRWIERGSLIAQLDSMEPAAEVARTEALRDQSEANYARVKAVVEANAAPKQDLDNALAGLRIAEANLAQAKNRFSKTHITAPFDGIVGARKISVGTFLRKGDAITELANIDDIRVHFSAPERFLDRLGLGAEVSVSTTAFPGHSVKGKILAIEPVLDADTRNARVVARVPNPGRKFHPGMSANVSVVLNERPSALTIPSEAVFVNGNQSFVFVVKPDSSVARVAVTLGLRLPDVVEVTGGLEPGSRVVRAGHQKLFDGAKVVPMTSAN